MCLPLPQNFRLYQKREGADGAGQQLVQDVEFPDGHGDLRSGKRGRQRVGIQKKSVHGQLPAGLNIGPAQQCPHPHEQPAEVAGLHHIVVFTGIEISSWGHDFKDGSSLIDLLEAVSAAAGDMRLRLGSLEPRTITEDFCRRAARLPNLCEQFHLSLQSGCDETLRRMNRRYDTARFAESVHLLRAYFDRPAITTDLITGFPGETEGEFAQTLDFIRACDFARMHIFPYSIRPGTKAAAMEQLPRAVKEERAARAAAVAEQMRQSYLAGCVGCTYPVLFEQPKDGRYAGHAPNYTDVEVDGENLHNEVRTVEITGVEGDILIGRIV